MDGSVAATALRRQFPDADGFDYERTGGDRFYDVELDLGPNVRGVDGGTYLATVREGGDRRKVVLKLVPRAGGPGGKLVEPRIQRLAAAGTNLPVPAVLAVADDPPSLPPYFVTARADGEAFEGRPGDLDPAVRARVLERAGRYLGELGGVAFDRAGDLRVDDDAGFSRDAVVPAGHPGGWPGYFRALAGTRIGRLAETPFADLRPLGRVALTAAADRVPDADPVLVHDDYRYANLLVDPGEGTITAVVDWYGSLAADPLYGLAKAEYLLVDYYEGDEKRRGELRERLRAGYREVRRVDTDAYRRVGPVYKLSAVAWQMYGFLLVAGNAPESFWRPHAERLRGHFERLAAAVLDG